MRLKLGTVYGNFKWGYEKVLIEGKSGGGGGGGGGGREWKTKSDM